MSRSDEPPFDDDGIPVLTDVVDAADLPAIPPPAAPDEADLDAEGPPSLAMFPELEPDALQAPAEQPLVPEPADPPADVYGAIPNLADESHDEAPESAPHAEPDWMSVTTDGKAFNSGDFLAAYALPAANSGAPPEIAELPAAAPEAVAPEVAAPTPPADLPSAETRDEMETRIFEALAARLEKLIDQRLEPVVEGSIEAAFAGVKAGLAASLNQAVREAVEQAVRDEFEKRPPA